MTLPLYAVWDAIKKADEEKLLAQEHYCLSKQLPIFVPADGKCYYCKKSVWDKITKEEAGTRHIESCPFCNSSFCD